MPSYQVWQMYIILHHRNPRFWIKTLHNLQEQSRNIQNLIFRLKNSFLWDFLVEESRVEYNGNWGFQDHTKRFFFFPLQTPESSLGYKYWISYLKLTPLLEGQVHFSFWRLQLTRLEYFYGGCICHYYFLPVC